MHPFALQRRLQKIHIFGNRARIVIETEGSYIHKYASSECIAEEEENQNKIRVHIQHQQLRLPT